MTDLEEYLERMDRLPSYAAKAQSLRETYVMIPRDELPAVRRVTVGLHDYAESQGPGSWSYGLSQEDAPAATDPAHLIAIVEWFQAQGIPMHEDDK